MAGVQRQGSHHSARPQTPASVYQSQSTSATHLLNHHQHASHHHPLPTTTHHVVHPRSHSRPPSAASHRYASNITSSAYRHGGSPALHGSLSGGVPSLKDYDAASPPPGMSSISFYHPRTGQAHMSSGPPQRSRSYTRAPSPSPSPTATAVHHPHHAHMLEEPPKRQLASHEFRRNPRRPALPPSYDGQRETRYVSMLLAMDDISAVYNIVAAFLAWIMLAGFVLLPSTFASWKNQPGTPQGLIASLIYNNDVTL